MWREPPLDCSPLIRSARYVAVLGAQRAGVFGVAQAIVQALIAHGVSASYARESLDLENGSKAGGNHADTVVVPEADIANGAGRFDWIISDNSALPTSLHDDLHRNDHQLCSSALAAPLRFALTLLVAPDKIFAASASLDHPGDAAVDAQLRQALDRGRVPYTVLHGSDSDSERVGTALRAIFSIANYSAAAGVKHMNLPEHLPSTWRCDDCSDADCERRLFTDLIARRSVPPRK